MNGIAGGTMPDPFGAACALLSAVMYALMVSCNKKAAEITGLENAALQLTAAFLAVFVFVLCRQGLHIAVQPADLPPLLILGLLNTGIGCFLYFSAISRIPVQTVAVLGYLEPLSAVLFSMLFLHESLSPLQVLGAVLILGGAILAELELPRRKEV